MKFFSHFFYVFFVNWHFLHNDGLWLQKCPNQGGKKIDVTMWLVWWKNESNHSYPVRNSDKKLIFKFFGHQITNFYVIFLYYGDLIIGIDVDSAYYFHKGYKGDMFYILGKDFWIKIEWKGHKKLLENGMKQKCFLLVQYVICRPQENTW